MRLINADAAWVKFENDAWWDIHDRRVAQDIIDSVPTVDAVPVVYAEWTEVGGTYTCSNCGGQYEKYDHMGYWNGEYKYCPYCGARMDGEE